MSYLDGVGFGRDQIAYDGPEFIQWDWVNGGAGPDAPNKNILLASNEQPRSARVVPATFKNDTVYEPPTVPKRENMTDFHPDLRALDYLIIIVLVIVIAMQIKIMGEHKALAGLIVGMRATTPGASAPSGIDSMLKAVS